MSDDEYDYPPITCVCDLDHKCHFCIGRELERAEIVEWLHKCSNERGPLVARGLAIEISRKIQDGAPWNEGSGSGYGSGNAEGKG